MRFARLLALAACLTACQPVEGAPAPTPSVSAQPTTLTGRVYDDDARALANATLQALDESGKSLLAVQTDGEGRYTMSLPAGTAKVRASKDDFTTREQPVAAGTLDFGGPIGTGGLSNPFFLTRGLEVISLEGREEAPGRDMVLSLRLSAAVTAASRENFLRRLRLENQRGEVVLRGDRTIDPLLRFTSDWSDDGRVFNLRYAGPYWVAGPAGNPGYQVRLYQEPLAEDAGKPVDEVRWEDMEIRTASGLSLGQGRASGVFLQPVLKPFQDILLVDKNWGNTPALRRWNLTHSPTASFSSGEDTQGPGLQSVQMTSSTLPGGATAHSLMLTLDEPMAVVRSEKEPRYTKLDKDKALVSLMVSTTPDGRSPKAIGAVSTGVRVSESDPRIVYIDYPLGAFDNVAWSQVTLLDAFTDPVGNAPNSAKASLTGGGL